MARGMRNRAPFFISYHICGGGDDRVGIGFYQSEEAAGNRLRLLINRIVEVVVVVALAVFTARFLCVSYTVSGHSMEPTLQNGDFVLTDTIRYQLFAPGRGDVIAFYRDDGTVSIKRIVGLPGETVQIKDGVIYIDGTPLQKNGEPFLVTLAGIAQEEIRLEADEYFVLGDHHDSSEDSRFANVGNVKRSQILGKVWIRLMPVQRLGFLSGQHIRKQR